MSKLFEKDLGEFGKVSGEIKEGGVLDLHFNGDVVVAARALAKKTATLLDDKIVNMLASLVGHKDAVGSVEAAPAPATEDQA